MFRSALDVRQIGWRKGRPLWLTLAPLRYESPLLGTELSIPAEFITDLASVPRLPLAYLLAGGKGNRSAVLHDFAYQFGFWMTPDHPLIVEKKSLADRIFYESLLADPWSGASTFDARLMWWAVKLGGKGQWADEERTFTLNPEWLAGRWPEEAA